MTSNVDCVYLVDLDGTLFRGNSFHFWVRYILYGGMHTVGVMPRWRCRATVLRVSIQRILGVIDHAGWKRRVQQAWSTALLASGAPERELDLLLTRLRQRVDHELLREVCPHPGRNTVAILTTAAAAEYADPLGQVLGFDATVATPIGETHGWVHNIGRDKCRRTIRLLEERGWGNHRRILYTDHADDLPMMETVDEVHIVTGHTSGYYRTLESILRGRSVRVYRHKR